MSNTVLGPTRIFGVLRRRWYVLVLAAILGGAGAFALAATVAPIYQSSTSLFFSLRTGASGSDINQGSTYTQNQMLSFAALATSSAVLDPVADELDGAMTRQDLGRAVSVTIPQNTVILDIRVDSTDRKLSSRAANLTATSLVAQVAEVSPSDADGQSTVSAQVIDPAEPAKYQSSPNKQQDALLGALLGLVLSSVILVLSNALDTRVRSAAALASVTDLPLLGVSERTPDGGDSRPVVLKAPNGPPAERFRQIRSGLRFSSASHEIRSVVVTSTLPGEGKTTVSANLALVLAEAQQRVLLIDADLRRPSVAQYFGFEGAVGLTSVLVGSATFNDVRQTVGTSTLDILAAGEIPPNPAELLASSRMRALIAEAEEEYDLVIVDTAPVGSVADATALVPFTDSAVIVVDATRVRSPQLRQTIDDLTLSGAHIAGVVLNKVKAASRLGDYYSSHTSDDETGTNQGKTKRWPRNSPSTQASAGSDSANLQTETHQQDPAGRPPEIEEDTERPLQDARARARSDAAKKAAQTRAAKKAAATASANSETIRTRAPFVDDVD
ncbi:polysaccharide biosynthesis tyrosine autokinase [Glaciibacter flavus]|uniref:non-specific protein-tyrosine kinase n=1 Tax=Orlajensenia flava TaxID=2565934 RepID=A0A4S4FMU0_9MICO|nr:polysaccharide biosynthesis tyrosine autokinase [Glaciibacter flavus]THG30546.1 polysaccharide biosynthesis tyrosine autokinase [Glaciibacter flavus]